jgi:hypothetical protein
MESGKPASYDSRAFDGAGAGGLSCRSDPAGSGTDLL